MIRVDHKIDFEEIFGQRTNPNYKRSVEVDKIF